jgi:hypothetical protein
LADVGAVRRRHDDDSLGRLEAVHLREHLVERLLALVVAAAETGAALAADRVDLVDEDDRPAHAARLLEQVAHAAGTDADEHLHEVRARDAEEPDAGLAGDRPGEQCLAGARGAHEEDALGDASADLAEAVGHPQEVDHLGDLLLDAVVAGDVVERGRRFVGRVVLGLALSDRHHVAHLALCPALHPDEEADDQQHRQHEAEDAEEPVVARWLELVVDALLDQQLLVGFGDPSLAAAGRVVLVAAREFSGDLARAGADDRGVDLAFDDLGAPLLVGERFTIVARPQVGHEERRREHTDEHPDHPAGPVRAAVLVVG